MILVDSSSSVGTEGEDMCSSTHISCTSSASISRGQGALVGLATPGVAVISRSPFRLPERR